MKLKSIAERAGVSVSTVARALRSDGAGGTRKSTENAQRIRKIAEELGYQPSWSGRVLSNGKTHTIGLPHTNPKWIFEEPLNEVAISLMNTLQTNGYGLRMIPLNDTYDWKSIVLGGACDGLVFLYEYPECIHETLCNSDIAKVVIGKKVDNQLCVIPDDVGGAYRAARHLLSLGHERVSIFIHKDIRDHESVQDRIEGYQNAMSEVGLHENVKIFRSQASDVIDSVVDKSGPSAVICYTQYEGMQLLQQAWINGVSVPADLSIISFNNVEVASLTTPALTTIGYDTQKLGSSGAKLLLDAMSDNHDEIIHHQLKEELFVRGSTSAVSTI